MRRSLLVLLMLAAGGPALAGQATATAPPKARTPVPAVAAPVLAPSFILPAPIPLAQSRPAGDAQQCKSTCAKTLYFCQAGGDDDGCGGRWAQCNSACTATYAPARYGR